MGSILTIWGGANWGIFDRQIGFHHYWIWLNWILCPKNLGKDTEIIPLAHFLEKFWLILWYGGHLGCHLEFHLSVPNLECLPKFFSNLLWVPYTDQQSKLHCTQDPLSPGLFRHGTSTVAILYLRLPVVLKCASGEHILDHVDWRCIYNVTTSCGSLLHLASWSGSVWLL